MTTCNPFDTSAALAAHARQPAGREYRLLVDDPETREEIRAEIQRRRVAEAHRRRRERELVAKALSRVD